MEQQELIPHLFRTEYRKITAVLSKLFGLEHIEVAEDIAGETFLAAMESWPHKGVPPNPTAWLYSVAKHKAINYLARNKLFTEKIKPQLKQHITRSEELEIDLSDKNISDSQLQMMFAVCHPSISPEAQVGLALRILCGFGIDEIADAFLTHKDTINKRLFRAKEKLREEKIRIEFPSKDEIHNRLDNVLTTIYLLFSEGYYSASTNNTIRKDLCAEAMRLCTMLTENSETNLPQVSALLALMCFHSSRFDARVDKNGEQVLYDEQDTGLWDEALIQRGGYYINQAARGSTLTKYHIEAAIAYWSTQKEDTPEKWNSVLELHNRLLQIEYSPMAALNRTYAVSKVHGKQAAIAEAEKLKQLTDYHFYYLLLGELYHDVDNHKAKQHFEKALSLAKTDNEKKVIQKKLAGLGVVPG